MADFRRDWDDLKERWAMLGMRRQVAAIVVAAAVIAFAAVWFLT